MTTTTSTPARGGQRSVLAEHQWRPLEERHHERADALLAGHLDRRRRGVAHPVEDFLFTYYSHKPAHLRRWHPGPGVVLLGDGARDRLDGRWYREAPGGGVELDVAAFRAARATPLRFVTSLLRAIDRRPANFGCFGLHEWAMVYRLPPEQVRHSAVPLRLGPEGTDRVVEEHRIRCSHFDAFRFFTPEARPLNQLHPTRDSQVELDQPGCLHATMDYYKWAYKLAPAVPGDLVLDCFELARDVRELDMRASPYDLSAHGYTPVAIETPEGKAEYVTAQRSFAERGAALRARLLQICETLNTAPDRD
ncbi:hypothetical protein SAMN02745673_04781 [Marinactinospora thermotolerans DSM 45154]|uniref:3-methyladenine DNA glycosylase n=1 Tax=Marinactinospora thermotolerans DSM 45154 TaxID=1122192 RepID=A0A1T4TCB9_9ACTN|nr:3-methyladenine DNA glycosylase [Marinactinospora thermotolerans]SKA38047.1 hypothetical protein SAMN02745673_04781 [Marinactinospora thermotolerans DSM 45154]